MTIERHAKHNPKASSAAHDPKGSKDGKPTAFVPRARDAAAALSSQLDKQMKRSPYVLLGMAGALGAGVGVALSSRILRAVVGATATALAVEMMRGFVRENIWPAPSPS
jgi:hypothetical protein